MDPVLERYLNERGLPESCLALAHATYEGGVLKIPRMALGFPDSEPIGWKCRDLIRNRFWSEPNDIPHSDTHPLVVPDVLPATGAMICEGESDTMRLACTDLPGLYSSDVICIPGATAFPSEWVPLLREYERVHVFADADAAGKALPDRLANLVPGTRCVLLPRGSDVCSFLLSHTEEDLRRLYEIAPLHVSDPVGIRKQNFQWDDAGSREHRDKLTRIILQSGVALRRRGARELVGLCPFHEERSPSFSVNTEKGLYRCFGCGASGDVISWLKHKHSMSFKEAMRYLEDYR